MPDSADAPQLILVRPSLIRGAVLAGLLGIASGAFAVLVFDWGLGQTLIAGLIGAITLGTAELFLGRIRARLPRGEVPEPPEGAFIDPTPVADEVRGMLRRSIWGIPLLLGFVWLVNQIDAGGLVIPGAFIGDGLAAAVGAIVATRWESQHRKRLLAATDDEGEETLYAGSPLARPDLLGVSGIAAQGPIHPS